MLRILNAVTMGGALLIPWVLVVGFAISQLLGAPGIGSGASEITINIVRGE